MTRKYTPAIFQATIRPSWAGVLSYISIEEKALILEALTKYPDKIDIKSKFWEETIKPDLDNQYEAFINICEARGRGARTYWGEHKLSLSYSEDEDKDNLSCTYDKHCKDKDKNKDKNKDNDNDKDKDNNNIYNTAFENFWKEYPKQRAGSKEKAYTSYKRIIKQHKVTDDDLLKACKIYASSDEVARGFAKGCAAWLNDDRYEQWKQGEIKTNKNDIVNEKNKIIAEDFLRRHGNVE